MIFRHLKMIGFKSFADQTALDIEQGLTGIVGPNGCGKSNIVEALRWVMGESNARQMRGTELDDIIFAGTQNRASRDLAEISLMLDNSSRRAPVDFNKSDDLEVTRKVERGKGSSYYVNGRPVRAKDVQLLFADTATGSRSAGMVSQGRIGAIVGAKPEDRRSLLEEAANIKGLHQRRHEAELRLKNAETNLERLADIEAQLAEQRAQLAKQARQASRYKSVADRIRKAEASLFLARWQEASTEDEKAKAALREATREAAAAAQQAAEAEKHHLLANEALPPLIAREAEAAAEFQRLKLAHEECDREMSRVATSLQQIANQLVQIENDRQREGNLQNDAQKALQDLADEKKELQAQLQNAHPEMVQKDAALAKAQDAATMADEAYAAAKESVTRFETAKAQHQQRVTQLQSRIDAAQAGLASLNLEALKKAADEAAIDLAAKETALAAANTGFDAAEAALKQQQETQESTAALAREAAASLASLTAQIDALSYILSDAQLTEAPPVSDSLRVSDDMEVALAALLADDLQLAAAFDELGYWRDDMPETPLTPPDVGTPLSRYVTGHPAIMTAIAGVAVIAEDSDAEQAQLSLQPGQALVRQSGQLWRWDGLVRQPNDGAAERLRQKAKLEDMLAQQEDITAAAEEAQIAEAQAKEAVATTSTSLQTARTTMREAEASLRNATREADKTRLSYQAAETRAADLTEALSQAQSDFEDTTSELDISGDIAQLTQTAEHTQQEAESKREILTNLLAEHASLRQQVQSAEQRIQAIDSQEQAWVTRLDNTDGRISDLATRFADATARQIELEAQPDKLRQQKEEIAALQDTAAARHLEAGDVVAAAQAKLREAEAHLRDTQREASHAREAQIRAEGQTERSADQLASLRQRIAEKLEAAPAQLRSMAEVSEDESLPPLFQLEDKVNRLLRERESIGPVNLRAEAEMAEIDNRLTEMATERDDLTEAIAKLRSAIAQLNREGRARLLESFADVNRYFKELFTTLFGGGQAELRLTESPDPLEAGLEILASPPGKKLQSLSLLSGGEQALTALAIIFAVFLTNPAPICVLDEVDAPLDDSNVSRFCDLLRDIVSRTGTRFLIVTHHRMTMAKMDRLYGVTMEQKGISRLVSVDLQTAESFKDSRFAG